MWHLLCLCGCSSPSTTSPNSLFTVTDYRLGLLVTAALALTAGCQRETPVEFSSGERVSTLTPELQTALKAALADFAGSHASPKLLGDDSVDQATLKRGQQVYRQRCAQCHGVTGDGQGPVAGTMYPRPRDYRKGIFKFTSTPYGDRPLRSDLVRTVTKGIHGTSMPSFKLLPQEEIDAVVDYVLALTRRGELEDQLLELVEFEEAVDPELVQDESVPAVINKWLQAQGSEVSPLTSQPVFSEEHVTRGQEAFKTVGCIKCHGPDGRGQTPDNLAGNLKDAWGHPTRAADLTSGFLHGGQRPIDIYRRIYSGINGTPMPGFANSLKETPDTIWDLVAFVMHITNARRTGESPLPGPIAPYIPQVADSETQAAEAE